MPTTTQTAQERYQSWLHNPVVDAQTHAELEAIANNPKEIEDRFYKDLDFGTGGLRGVMGAGSNRMNVYTIRKTAQGIANHLLQASSDTQALSVVFAYDSRRNSQTFAEEAALVFAANGIKAYVFDSLRPTPELSFAVRFLQTSAGVVITASHNPPEYNGFKVYGPDGCQAVPELASRLKESISRVDEFSNVKTISKEEAIAERLFAIIGEEVDAAYSRAVTNMLQRQEVVQAMGDQVAVLYTPLHGSGNLPVRRVLREAGFQHVYVVPEQELPDSEFSTVTSPNPEEHQAFTLAIAQADKTGTIDVIIGTDPDCDRVGVVIRDENGKYDVLNGNQTGALLCHYIVSAQKEKGVLPHNGVVIKTIVTSEFGAVIAKSFGVDVINTLTGFKYIGEKIGQFEQTGEHRFLFGYEESYGYLAGTYARDKDAVVASMLVCEMVAYYKQLGKTLHQALQDLYRQYGYFLEGLQSLTLKGIEGIRQIEQIMQRARSEMPSSIAGFQVEWVEDYKQGLYGLPKENVVKVYLQGDSWFCIRPSGTEPKLKVYFGTMQDSFGKATETLQTIQHAAMQMIDGFQK
ncbi:phospho-sugar mutase [Fodinisporobacter ferrooxydans]|uniref:phosphoglucomutase (alpha-D-glucose-1,6-bisphosphate-dependent) n=1 Tax=Fodinisporobacter ferrooxydans TaxID=2901836 RepID=A0ABY4CLS2_9BACL|nr:phospho-sugar mutase [Alicyclobacillaceae bacterium MYW30-H2]